VKIAPWLGALLALAFAVSPAPAANSWGGRFLLDRLNPRLHGQVLDFTHNHGQDHRIWSESLHEKRDLYVYVPPDFDPNQRYPVVIYLHTFREDEVGALKESVVALDKAIACGQLPPMIIAIPDGSIYGKPEFCYAGSFFVNSSAGNFGDFIVKDVWNFLVEHFPIRPEPEAHVLFGTSMGGFGAFNLGFKYRDQFKVIVGLLPPLNLRWVDCHDRYHGPFDPDCWGWRTELRPHEVIARIFGIPVRMGQLTHYPLRGEPDPIGFLTRENPIELLEHLDVKPGEVEMYIAYAGKDQFNIQTQVESFLHVAHDRGLKVDVGYKPDGRHGPLTAKELLPGIFSWLKEHLEPYAPK
jgi:hypothetical protein